MSVGLYNSMTHTNATDSFFVLSYDTQWYSFNLGTNATATGGIKSYVIEENSNISGVIGAGGDYGKSNSFNGGDYVNGTRPRYDGKVLSYKVLFQAVSCASVFEAVRDFVQGMTAGVYVLGFNAEYLAFDLRLVDEAKVTFYKNNREAIVEFTLASSYPFLVDYRLTTPNVHRDTSVFTNAVLTKSTFVKWAGIPVLSGVHILGGNDLTVTRSARYALGYPSTTIYKLHTISRVPAENESTLLCVGGNLGIVPFEDSTGKVYVPTSSSSYWSVGYPLVFAGEQVRIMYNDTAIRTGIGRVYL